MMRSRLPYWSVAFLLGTVLGCERTNVYVPAEDGWVSFLVVVNAGEEVSQVSLPVYYDTQRPEISMSTNLAVNVESLPDAQLFVVQVSSDSVALQDVCWTRSQPIVLEPRQERTLVPGALVQTVYRALPEDARVARVVDLSEARSRLQPVDGDDLSWLAPLALRVDIDSEHIRSSHQDIEVFDAESILRLRPKLRSTPRAQDLVRLSPGMLLMALNDALVVLEEGSLQVDDDRWVSFSFEHSKLADVAVGTSTSGMEIIAVGGDFRPQASPNPAEYSGVLIHARWTEEAGLQVLEVRDFEDHQLHSVSIRDQEVLMGGSRWTIEQIPPEREPVVYRWSLTRPLPQPSEAWQVLQPSASYADNRASKVAITGQSRFRYVVATRGNMSTYDTQTAQWKHTEILPAVNAGPQDFTALALDPHDASQWWIASDEANVFRTTDAGQSWQQVHLVYPPRFSECGVFDERTSKITYRNAFDDILMMDDVLFFAPEFCEVVLTVHRSCLQVRPNQGLVASCISVLPPLPEVSEPRCQQDLAQNEGWFLGNDRRAPSRFRLVQENEDLLVGVRDGTIYRAHRPSGN